MYHITPAWIISLLPEGEKDSFCSQTELQFRAYTENELGFSSLDPGSPQRWWGIEHLSSSDFNILPKLADITAPLCLKGAYPNDASANYLNNRLNIIFYTFADQDISNTLSSYMDALKNLPFSLDPMVYWVIYLQPGNFNYKELGKLWEIPGISGIILQGNSNRCTANPDGFPTLVTETITDNENQKTDYQRVYQLGSLTVLDLALGFNIIHKNNIDNLKVFYSGSFGLTCEPLVQKSEFARKYITNPLLQYFLNNSSDPEWRDVSYIPEQLPAVLSEFDASNFYNNIVFRFGNDFSELENFFKHKISPWSLLNTELTSVYFDHELSNIAANIVDYGRIVDMQARSNYRHFLENEIYGNNGPVEKAFGNVHKAATLLWESAGDETPVGLQQLFQQIGHIRSKLQQEKLLFENDDEFRKISADIKPLKIPDIIRDAYKKEESVHALGIEPSNPEEDARISGESEEHKVKKLIRKIQFHPVPLSLLLRIILVCIGAAFLVFSVRACSSEDTWISNWKNSLIVTGVAVAATLFFVLIRYGIFTLRSIRHLKREYLGWVFYRIQHKLLLDTRSRILTIYDSLIDQCNQMARNLQTFYGQQNNDAEDEPGNEITIEPVAMGEQQLTDLQNGIATRSYKYPVHFFQQDVFQPIDESSSYRWIDHDLSKHIYIESGYNRIPLVELNPRNLRDVFQNFFITGEYWSYFFENAIKSANLTSAQFANDLHRYADEITKNDISGLDQLNFTTEAVTFLENRAFPPLIYNNNSYRSSYKFTNIVWNTAQLPDSLNQIEQLDNSTTFIKITMTEPGKPGVQTLGSSGYLLLSRYIRLTGPDDFKPE